MGFAHNIAAWTFVPGMNEMGNFSNAMSAAIFTWLGFIYPENWEALFGKKILEAICH